MKIDSFSLDCSFPWRDSSWKYR